MFETPKRKKPPATTPTSVQEQASGAGLGGHSPRKPAALTVRPQQAPKQSSLETKDAGPRLSILAGHGRLMGSHQSTTFEAAHWGGSPRKGRVTFLQWELRRSDEGEGPVVMSGTGSTFKVTPGLPGLYTVHCTVEEMDGPSELPAVSTAVASRRPPEPGAHAYNPYQDVEGQKAEDTQERGDRRRKVLAREQYDFRVLDEASYAQTLLEHHKIDHPLGTLEEELQLLPQQNAANETLNQQEMSDVARRSEALRDLVNKPGMFPGMGFANNDSDGYIRKVHAVLSQNDGQEVHMRLFLGTISRGDERLVRLVELPVMNEAADANKVRAFHGTPYRDPKDRFGSFMAALNDYVQNGPHGQGVLRYEVEGEAFSGTVTKGPSDLEQSAEAFDQVGRVTALLSLIPPIALPCRVATALFKGGAAAMRMKDKYNKTQDNTGEAVDAAINLLEFGVGLAPEGTGSAVMSASKKVLKSGKNTAEVVQAVHDHQAVDPEKALTILKDALMFGKVVSPEGFALANYSLKTRRVILQLSQAYELGGKVSKYVSMPEDFTKEFTDLVTTEGISETERKLKLLELMNKLK